MVLSRRPFVFPRLFCDYLSATPLPYLSVCLCAPLGHDKIPGVEGLLHPLKLFYTDSENTTAPAVVFIHAFPFNRSMWEEQAALVKPTFRTVTYDQRSQGQSAAISGRFMFESLVDDLVGLLDHLKIDKAILCGL